MGFKLKSSKNDPMSEINVTPFVDVMLVLLIFLNILIFSNIIAHE